MTSEELFAFMCFLLLLFTFALGGMHTEVNHNKQKIEDLAAELRVANAERDMQRKITERLMAQVDKLKRKNSILRANRMLRNH